MAVVIGAIGFSNRMGPPPVIAGQSSTENIEYVFADIYGDVGGSPGEIAYVTGGSGLTTFRAPSGVHNTQSSTWMVVWNYTPFMADCWLIPDSALNMDTQTLRTTTLHVTITSDTPKCEGWPSLINGPQIGGSPPLQFNSAFPLPMTVDVSWTSDGSTLMTGRSSQTATCGLSATMAFQGQTREDRHPSAHVNFLSYDSAASNAQVAFTSLTTNSNPYSFEVCY
jgi:hypothetical protein